METETIPAGTVEEKHSAPRTPKTLAELEEDLSETFDKLKTATKEKYILRLAAKARGLNKKIKRIKLQQALDAAGISLDAAGISKTDLKALNE